MEWIRYHPRTAATAAGVLTLLIIVVLWKAISPSSHTDAAPQTVLPAFVPPTSSPTPKAIASINPKGTSTSFTLPSGFTTIPGGGTGGSGSAGSFTLQGLQGGSVYKNMAKHSITLLVTSEAPIGTVGYVMPTSLRHQKGVVKHVGDYWTLSSFVYGDPDYAQIFLQAGQRGYPITCTITVDGHVTARRSTDGPYGQLICQG
jgi:hypothetical protein